MSSESEHKKIDVFILTGFFGAGKTTLLNHLLEQFAGEKNVVIENEFGKVNIDSQLISNQYESVFELTNGCVCCTMDEPLFDVLAEIANNENKPDRIFMQLTGIADAGAVASIFKESPIDKIFDLRKVICITAAESVEDYLKETEETPRQMVAADLIVINKTDLVNKYYLPQLTEIIQAVNQFSKILFAQNGFIAKELLLEDNSLNNTVFTKIFNAKNPHSINNILYESEGKFDMNLLRLMLENTLYFNFETIFRIKGFVQNVDGEIYEVQSTGKNVTFNPTQREGFLKNQLVLIGRKLKTDKLTMLLNQLIIVPEFA